MVPSASYRAVSTWKRLDFEYDIIIEGLAVKITFVTMVSNAYFVNGQKAKIPGNGGNGGVGGFGGIGGKTFLFGVERNPDFGVVNTTGKNIINSKCM